MRKIRTATLLILLLLAGAALTACGSGDAVGQPGAVSDDGTGELEPVPILKPDSAYSVDDLVAAGWKKSKELSAETLPGAQSAWYGFYQQRDVEVRIYASHAAAIEQGSGPADDATGRGKPAPFAVGGISATRTSYGAYAIVGNLVLLCEVQISECAGLYEALD